eukprot:COSAG06_NODE_455_length_15521_cov_8.312022_22_plen_115_part_00
MPDADEIEEDAKAEEEDAAPLDPELAAIVAKMQAEADVNWWEFLPKGPKDEHPPRGAAKPAELDRQDKTRQDKTRQDKTDTRTRDCFVSIIFEWPLTQYSLCSNTIFYKTYSKM